MTNTDKTRLAGLLIGASLFAAVAQAQTPAVPAPKAAPAAESDAVSEVTVTGTKLPDALATKAATCEALVEKNPGLRAELAIAQRTGNPMMGTRLYLPTRAPRNPDYSAAPLSQPGSAIPEVSARWKGARAMEGAASGETVAATDPAAGSIDGTEFVSTETASSGFGGATNASRISGAESNSDGSQSALATLDNTDVDTLISICRGFYTQGGGSASKGRSEIAGRDKTLPTGIVLFDDGRYVEALDYFQQAYRKLPLTDGGDEAALMIGKIHLFALGEKSNTQEGVMWLKRAAGTAFNPVTSTPVFDPKEPDRNTAIGEAALLLARLHLSGATGVAKDPAEARKWFERAAYVGHVPADKMLGDLYLAGSGGPKDSKKAFERYSAAAKLGYAPAQYAVAEMYYTGGHGGAPDVAKALAWYNEAAKLDHPRALYALALAYDTGDGVPADPEKAVTFYKQAALKGHVPSMTSMGTYFYEGGVVAKDHVMARQWFQAAASAGDADAMFNLGAMLVNGQGGEVDRERAWVWFKRAEARGIANAGAAIKALEGKMTAEERSGAAALLAPKT